LRLISASVGSVAKGVVTAVLPTLRGRAASGSAQNGSSKRDKQTHLRRLACR
jgi:hypothetical protein